MPDNRLHSPLGASSAERWMHCPGSNVLLKSLNLPPSDEADYLVAGIAAHEVAAKGVHDCIDGWEMIGTKFYKDTECTPAMADAVQTYLNFIRPLQNEFGTWWCEFRISNTEVHKDFYGTVDFAAINEGIIDIVDYKHGEGIVVEPYRNPQLMYYAYGFLQFRPDARRVRLTIVQPRAYHEEGPVRTWELSAEELAEWGEKTLVPAMRAAEIDETFDAGPWCRFCPAKLVCPLLDGLFKASANIDPKRLGDMADEALTRDYQLIQAIEFRIKAIEDEIFRRLQTGRSISGVKLVNKRSKRVFKNGAEEVLNAQLGAEIYTAPELKSPSQIEALGPKAKKLVNEYAFMPFIGLTVAPEDDKRQAVKAEPTTTIFAEGLAKLAGPDVV